MSQPKACCNIPPVQTGSYDGKGEYIKLNGVKTYRTGPKDSKRAIFVVMDIFGYFPQTIQGADILAHSDADHQYQVFLPDFFEGEPADISWYPPGDDKDKQAKMGEWWGKRADVGAAVGTVGPLVDAIKKEHGVEELAILGYCWGGKVATVLSQENSLFEAGAEAHPAMLDGKDAAKITIPFALLPSKDEPEDDIKNWEKEIKGPHIVERFPTQIHGWMAARSDLKDDKVKKEYERGYTTVLEFFHKYL